MFTISIQRDGYLLASASGKADLTDLCGMTMLVAEVARRGRSTGAVLDLLTVVPLLTPAEHEELGRFIAQKLAGLRIASVVPLPERVTTSEQAARRAGLNIRTFTDLVEAEGWITGKAH